MSDFMRWLLTDLEVDNNKRMPFEREIHPNIKDFETITRLKEIKTFVINGVWYYDEIADHLYSEFNLTGNVVVSDSLNLEDVEITIDADTTEVFGFDQLDDVAMHLVENNQVDLEPIINQVIVANIPFNVGKENRQYPKGEDWEIISEADFNKRPKKVNPKMAKLLELEIDE